MHDHMCCVLGIIAVFLGIAGATAYIRSQFSLTRKK